MTPSQQYRRSRSAFVWVVRVFGERTRKALMAAKAPRSFANGRGR